VLYSLHLLSALGLALFETWEIAWRGRVEHRFSRAVRNSPSERLQPL